MIHVLAAPERNSKIVMAKAYKFLKTDHYENIAIICYSYDIIGIVRVGGEISRSSDVADSRRIFRNSSGRPVSAA